MKIEMICDDKFFETYGAGTLLGKLVNIIPLSDLKEVILKFPQSTELFRTSNNGPYQYIVNEYTIVCFMEDVLRLKEMNINVKLNYDVF